ncbi:MAG: long-chain acyl-CoA synthetase, partial [Candidatus Omnitrophota bacterium]
FVKSIAQISGLLKRRLRNQFGGHLHTMVCGGAQMDVRIMHDFQGWGFCFLEGYGLSETAPVVSFNFKDNQKIGSVGKPLPGVDVRINQPDEKGYGEVCVKGPNVMMGYYEDKIQTDKVLSDGWFQTGDIGFLDEEGYLYLTGRMKEMIVLPSGKNIFPHEIESLYEASPFIQEIGVVEYDKELVCVISPNNEHFKAEGLAQIRDRLLWEVDTISGNLPSYQRLKGFAITTDPLPRTRLGKLQRYQLPELYKALKEDKHERSAEKGIEDLENYKKKAVGMIEARLDKKVQLADHLELDLGLDSLNKVEMLLELQEGLGLQLDDDTLESFFMCGTVQELLYALEKSGGNSCDNSDGDVKECEINWANVLNDELDDKTKSRIKLEFGFFSTTFNFGVILLVKIIVKMCFLLEVKGRDNLPKDGAYLLCPNHVSYLDAFFIIAALPFKVVVKTYFLGIDKFFKNTIVSPFIRQFRLIPIEVNYNLVNALGACGYVYKNGKNACYFAEGQRSIDGNIKEFKKGIGILTKEFDTTVVPVYIAGGFKVWPRNQKWPRLAKVSVSFGDVWRPQEVLDGNEDQNDYVILAENLRQKVATLG